MCELFGMSARHATDVNHSLALIRPRGGEVGPHADGWGVAFYEGRAARVVKEPAPAADSRCLAFLTEYGFRSRTVVGHIRKANPSAYARSAANTHPFEREVLGRSWVFAHNGKVPALWDDPKLRPGRYLPIGETDSELAFCLLLDRVALASLTASARLPTAALVAALGPLIGRLTEAGELNFLLTDGERLIAHAHTNLHVLTRTCREGTCDQRVLLLATAPLSDEPWERLEPGVYVYEEGRQVYPATGARTAKEPTLAVATG